MLLMIKTIGSTVMEINIIPSDANSAAPALDSMAITKIKPTKRLSMGSNSPKLKRSHLLIDSSMANIKAEFNSAVT